MIVIGLIALMALLAWVAYEVITAPSGWQDAEGFHEGEMPKSAWREAFRPEDEDSYRR